MLVTLQLIKTQSNSDLKTMNLVLLQQHLVVILEELLLTLTPETQQIEKLISMAKQPLIQLQPNFMTQVSKEQN